MGNKSNLISLILYLIVMIPILLALLVFHNEPWCWKILSAFYPNYCCGADVYLIFYTIIIPLISAVFSSILRIRRLIVVPVSMFFLVFLSVTIYYLWYDISRGCNICEHNNIDYVLLNFMISIPTFVGSIIGISVRNSISKLKDKYFS